MTDNILNTGKPKRSNIYLKAEDFQAEYDKSVQLGEPTSKLLNMFEKIAKRFSTTFQYYNTQDRDACVNFALTEAWLKWKKYDRERCDNIFAFFTTMISNDMRLHYNNLMKGKDVNISIDALFDSDNNK